MEKSKIQRAPEGGVKSERLKPPAHRAEEGGAALERQKQGLLADMKKLLAAKVPHDSLRRELEKELAAAAEKVFGGRMSETPDMRKFRAEVASIFERLTMLGLSAGEKGSLQNSFEDYWQEIKSGTPGPRSFLLTFVYAAMPALDPSGESRFKDKQLMDDIINLLQTRFNTQLLYPRPMQRFDEFMEGGGRAVEDRPDVPYGCVVKVIKPGVYNSNCGFLVKAEVAYSMS